MPAYAATSHTPSDRRNTAGRLVLGAGLAVWLACGATPGRAADPLNAVAVAGKTVLLTLHAEGVQIYQCRLAADGSASWTFREPLATLLRDGKTVGRHFAGPSWQLADGSAVMGKVAATAAGATVADIPWLRLDVVDHRGAGDLATVTAVQRIDTRGGAFSGTCTQPGAFHLEPYAADYVFSAG